MRAFDLALKDLMQITRDWKAALFLVVMPIIFTLLFGFAFGGFGGVVDARLPVGVVDKDNGRFAPALSSLLSDSDVIRIAETAATTEDEMRQQVDDEDLAAALVIPAGYSDSLLTAEPMALIVYADTNANAGITAQGELQVVANRLTSSVQAAIFGTAARAEAAAFANDAAQRRYFDAAVTRAIAAWQEPPVAIADRTGSSGDEDGTDTTENAFAHSAPGMMLQFAIAGLIGAAEVVVNERKSRTLQRLLTTAISRAEVLLGHFMAMFLMIFTQLLALVLFGQLFLRLDYLQAPLATLLLVISTALFAAALGLLIGALARNEDQVVIFALVPMFVLSGIGGAWVPLELTGETFQAIGHVSPVAWAMDGFKDILLRGQGLDGVLVSVGMLLLYALVLCALAIWQFRFE